MMNFGESRSRGDRSKIPTTTASLKFMEEIDEPLSAIREGNEFVNGRLTRLGGSKMETISHISAMDEKSKATVALNDSLIGAGGSRDSDEAAVTIRSKIEHLNQEYTFLCNQAAETKHSVAEMKEELKLIVSMLEKQQIHSDSKKFAASQHPGPLNLQLQVHNSDMELNRRNLQLGYRTGNWNVAIDDNRSKESLPMFDGTNPCLWISKSELFLRHFRDEDKLVMMFAYLEGAAKKWFAWVERHGGFSDWDDFKQKLLVRFEHVTSYVKGVSVSSVDCQVYSYSSLETMLKKAPLPESELILKTDSLLASDHKSKLRRKIETPDCVVKTDSFLRHEAAKSLNLELEAVQNMGSLSPVQETVVIQQNSSHQNRVLVQENESSLLSEHDLQSITVSHLETSGPLQLQHNEHSVFGLIHETALVYGTEVMLQVQTHSDLGVEVLFAQPQEQSSSSIAVTLTNLLQLSTEVTDEQTAYHLSAGRLLSVTSKSEQRKCVKTWKFKFKAKQYKNRNKVYIRWAKNLCTRWMRWSTRRKSSFNAVVAEMMFLLVQYDSFKASTTQNLLAFIDNFSIQRPWLCSIRQILHEFQQFTAGEGNFKVKHKWRFKQFTQALLLEQVADISTELQPFGSWHERYLLIFISSSLRASLFLREGVYKGYLTYLLIVDRLIWLLSPVWKTDILLTYLKSQSEETELITQCLLQAGQHLIQGQPEKRNRFYQEKVSIWMNHHLSTKREGLLIHIQRITRLQVLTHHKRKWKKYKCWMFITRGESGTWQNCNYGELSVYASNSFRQKFGSIYLLHHSAHILWSGWSVLEGNRMMHQLQRSKLPKLWKYRYNLATLLLFDFTLEVKRHFKGGSIDRLVYHIPSWILQLTRRSDLKKMNKRVSRRIRESAVGERSHELLRDLKYK